MACGRYIDSRAENGVTALHLAAVHGDLACVLVLLQAGASMMVRTVDLDMVSTLSIPAGSTPLHLAAQRGQVAIVQAMLQVNPSAAQMPPHCSTQITVLLAMSRCHWHNLSTSSPDT